MKNQEVFWKAQCLRFAEALVRVLDGVKEHELQAETGLNAEDCAKILKAKEDAILMLNRTKQP
jgi:hypothetical protein